MEDFKTWLSVIGALITGLKHPKALLGDINCIVAHSHKYWGDEICVKCGRSVISDD